MSIGELAELAELLRCSWKNAADSPPIVERGTVIGTAGRNSEDGKILGQKVVSGWFQYLSGLPPQSNSSMPMFITGSVCTSLA